MADEHMRLFPTWDVRTREQLDEILSSAAAKPLFSKHAPALAFSTNASWEPPLDHDLFSEAIPLSRRADVFDAYETSGTAIVYPDFVPQPYPEDLACSLDNPQHIQEVYDRYGVVIIENILDARECAATRTEIWKTIGDLAGGDVSPDNAATWRSWPQGQRFGLLGMGTMKFLEPQGCLNRVKCYEAFRAVIREDELITNITRAGCMRPTRNVWWDDEPHDMPKWKSLTDWVHIDSNPFTGQTTSYGFTEVGGTTHNMGYGNPRRAHHEYITNPRPIEHVQAILAIADCPVDVGGFHALPGFQAHTHTWAALHAHLCLSANASMDPSTVQLPEDDPLRAHVQRFPLKAGALLIWNSLLPHGNFPNEGAGPAGPHNAADRCRYVQYVHMAAIRDRIIQPYPLEPCDVPVDLSPLGQQLYGFAPWPSEQGRERFQAWQEVIAADQDDYRAQREGVEQQRAFKEYVRKEQEEKAAQAAATAQPRTLLDKFTNWLKF